MNFTLSWDLFIIVFFAIVISYSFIIGKTQSVKVIIASYISIIATQGIGNVIERLSGNSNVAMQIMDVPVNLSVLAGVKIFLFAFFIIVLSMRSGIAIAYAKESSSVAGMVFTALFGFATAGLIVSTILTYATGKGILDMSLAIDPGVLPLVENSVIMLMMILNQDIWFTLPALLIIAAGFIQSD
jgi:hypothetical protein